MMGPIASRMFHLALGFALLSPMVSTGAAREAGSQQSEPVAAQAAGPALPDPAKLRILIINNLIALNQGNLTGNYTVLRDMGATEFRAAHTDANLAELFAELRHRRIDLAPIVVFDPKLSRAAEIDKHGVLRLLGFFETAPEQVAFDLALVPEQGDWRLVGIAVQLRPAVTEPVSPAPVSRTDQAVGSTPAKTPKTPTTP